MWLHKPNTVIAQTASLVLIWEMEAVTEHARFAILWEAVTVTDIRHRACSDFKFGDDLGNGSADGHRDPTPWMLIMQVW